MKLPKFVALVLVGLIFLSIQCMAKSAEENYQSFSVTFEQDGKIVSPNAHVLNLQKKEFTIIITFLGYRNEPVAVRLHTSMNDTYYTIASTDKLVADLLGDGLGMAEPAEVSGNLIVVDRKAVQYFFIDGSKSRFHEVLTANNSIIGKRHITQISGGAIENLPVNELYLVFIKRGEPTAQQEYYKIQFSKVEMSEAEKWLFLGFGYEQKKDLGSAVDAYTKALTINPQYYEAYICRGTAYAKIGKLGQAIDDCNRAIATNYRGTKGYLLRGAIYAATKRMEQAVEDYTTVLSIEPNNTCAYFQRGMLYYNTGKTLWADKEKESLALADFSRVIELEPNNSKAYEMRAEVYILLKDNNKALVDYDKVLSFFPNDIKMWEKHAMCYRFMGNWDKEFEDRNKIMELDPQNPIAYSTRASVGEYVSHKDMNQVIADYSKAIELSQGQADKPKRGLATEYYYRGNAYRANGQPAAAIADFTTAITLDPGYVVLYHSRGAAYFENGEYDLAIADCTKAIGLSSGNPWTYLVRGKAYKAKGMTQEALDNFNNALAIQSNLQEAITERDSLQEWDSGTG